MIDEVLARFILAVLVLAVGLLFLLGLYRFGTTLFGHQASDLLAEIRDFIRHFGPDKYGYQWWAKGLSHWHQT